jgi:hypothetical protein
MAEMLKMQERFSACDVDGCTSVGEGRMPRADRPRRTSLCIKRAGDRSPALCFLALRHQSANQNL